MYATATTAFSHLARRQGEVDRLPRGQHRERGGCGNGCTIRAHGKAVFHNDASLHRSAGLAESINGVSSLRHLNNLLYVQLVL
jgi:hypothetical protein